VNFSDFKTNNIPLCKDCKFYSHDPDGRWMVEREKCSHPAVWKIDIINGETIKKFSAYGVRDNQCGVEGKLFEPK